MGGGLPGGQPAVHGVVKKGEYATENEVILECLRALMAPDQAAESWLHQQVGLANDVLKADPLRAVAADQPRARLAAEHANAR